MRFRIKKRRLIGIALVICSFIYLKIATRNEASRIYLPLSKAQQTAPQLLNHSQLLEDVKTLSSPKYEGRRTGSPGNKRAQQFILARFRDFKLQPVGASFLQKFSFVHHSIKGLVLPSRKFKQFFPDATNLMASVAGVKKRSSFIVLSAHYDHVGIRNGVLYPGADDNASGVATVLSCAKYFSEHPPVHSLLFALFDAEELDLEGSEAFFKNLPVEKKQIALNINLDMVSHNDKNQIFASGTYHNPFLKQYVFNAQKHSTVTVLLGHDRPMYRAGFVEDWTGSSDHGPFHDHDIPFLYFGVEDHEDYHQPSDTFENINEKFFVGASEMILQTLLECDQRL